jgi:hypothetical protein
VTTTIRRSFAALCVLVALTGAASCSSGDDDAADFCKKYRTFEDANKDLARSNAKNIEDLDLDDVHSQFSRVADQIAELEGTAPDEIATPVKTVKQAFDALNEDAQDADTPQDFLEVGKDAASDTKAQKASDRIDDWIQDNCDSNGDTKN